MAQKQLKKECSHTSKLVELSNALANEYSHCQDLENRISDMHSIIMCLEDIIIKQESAIIENESVMLELESKLCASQPRLVKVKRIARIMGRIT